MKPVVVTDSRPEDLLQFEFASARARATWVYGMLRSIMDVPRSLRTARLEQLTARIDEHPHRDEIRTAFREFWSHHSYVRVISEAGLPGYDAVIWLGLIAPKNTPPDIINTLNAEINRALSDPKMKARFADLGGVPLALSPTEFGQLIAHEAEKWGKVIRSANIKPA